MWPYPKALAHRGGGTLAPENTIAGLACGLAHGFHAVEFDVMLAKDGVPVLMHDPELGRTVSGKGKVSDYTSKQLAEMDAGSWLAFEFTGEPVPSASRASCKRSCIVILEKGCGGIQSIKVRAKFTGELNGEFTLFNSRRFYGDSSRCMAIGRIAISIGYLERYTGSRDINAGMPFLREESNE